MSLLRVSVLALVLSLVCAAAAEAETMRLRIAWGGGAERQWHGSVRLSGGTLADVQPLGIEADEPGSIWLDGGEVVVNSRSERAYDGVDVLVTAEMSESLIVELATAGVEPTRVEIALGDLVGQAHSSDLAERNRLLVTRAPGDRLRVSFDAPSLVFAAGETFRLDVEPHLLGLPAGTPLWMHAQLTGAATGARIWSHDYDFKTPAAGEDALRAELEIKLPEVEGVYDLTLSAINSRLPQAIRWKRPLADRKVQLVVVGKRGPQADADKITLTKVLEFDPVNPRWWERFANLPLFSGLHKGPLGNGDAAKWDHPKLGPMIQLGAIGAASGVSWEAYPLPVSSVGQPHVLEVEYPSDVPQTMGLSLLEPNAAGAVTPIGLDSGVYVSDEDATAIPQLARHRLVFWPRTKTPLLLVTNRRQGSRAVYGKIRVLAYSQAGQFGALPLVGRSAEPPTLPRAFADSSRKPQRLLAGYLDRPLFAENFSAAESLDPLSNRSLDDWTTFYQGGTRLVEYLQHVGLGGVMLGVAADGGAIYPSRHLEATPQYDTGVFFASGQDPQKKDVLELLFRLFDRAGLQLIPAVHFATPLPALEALKRDGGEPPVGIEWIGASGATWMATHPPKRGLAAYYNPLDPRVQDAMLAVITELAERYGNHPSFAGLAVELSAEGYAQLPSGDGSYDDATIARFEREAKVQVPGAGATRFAARATFLNGAGSKTWLSWRAGVMADFHRRLQKTIAAARPEARLYLAGASMFDSPTIQRSLRPGLPRRMKVEEVLLALGIRPQAYAAEQGIVLLRPQRVAPIHSLASQAVDLELNSAPEVDRLYAANRSAGTLFFHEPQRTQLASFDAKSPFGPANTYTWLMSELLPSGDRNRRRFIHSLATHDTPFMFDGGWLLALGQEDSLRDLIAVYRELPAEQFETLTSDSQPITLRTLARDTQTTAYLVNDSPWSATVKIALDLPAGCRMEKLGPSRGVSAPTRGTDGMTWTLNLKPYDLVAANFTSANVRFGRPQVTLSEDAEALLTRRIQDLSSRAAALANPTPMPVLENLGFELPGRAGEIPGWRAMGQGAVIAEIDTNEKREGGQAIRFATTGKSASLRSSTFPTPQTGRLSVALWLRVADKAQQPTLRLAIEGKLDGGEYYRYATVGGAGPSAVPLGTQWAQYVFQVDDLPAAGLVDLRVRFDLVGAGEVWIDDLQLFELAFSENERVELTKIITLANFKLQKGELSECLRLLEGYWPQFLVANVPLAQTPGPLAMRPKNANKTPPPPAPKPGMSNPFKGLLPKLF